MREGLNYNHLECFFCLAQTLSFSLTANELDIAQPAVSRQIKSLEEYYEKQLFIRNRQFVKITPFGQKLYDLLYPLYKELSHRSQLILEEKNTLKGVINIGSLQEVGEKVLLPILSQFKKEQASLTVNLQLLKGFEIVDKVKNGELDLGLVANKIIQENIRCYKVLDEEIILVTGKKDLTNPTISLSKLPFVAYRKNDPLLISFMQKHSPKTRAQSINTEFFVNSQKSMVDVLKAHDYYAILPRLSVQTELENKELFRVKNYRQISSLFLIHKESEYPDHKTKALSTYLKERFKGFQLQS